MSDIIDILLVDDEQRNLDALEVVLADPGYRLLRTDEVDRALRMLLEHDVAAIVLDIKMPEVSGFELAQLIKGTKRFREIPILFLTAHMVDDQDVLAGYDAHPERLREEADPVRRRQDRDPVRPRKPSVAGPKALGHGVRTWRVESARRGAQGCV
jgi:CheY-like chemotaxis protein